MDKNEYNGESACTKNPFIASVYECYPGDQLKVKHGKAGCICVLPKEIKLTFIIFYCLGEHINYALASRLSNFEVSTFDKYSMRINKSVKTLIFLTE